MTLDELEGEKCAYCASQFEARQVTQIYCSADCRSAARYDEHEGWRARQREMLACVRCATPIVGAVRRDRQLCDKCQKRAAHDRINKYRRKRAAEKRERALANIVCVNCSAPIMGAQVTWRTLCDDCRRIRRAQASRRYKAKIRERAQRAALTSR